MLAVVAATLFAGIAATAAYALAFDDAAPCPVTIENGQPLLVCPSGILGTGYSLQLVGRGGCEPHFTFTVINGSLPSGLSMSSSGLITGTPTHAGTARFWVRLHDLGPSEGGPVWCTNPRDAEREFMLAIAPRVIVTTESAAPATVGQAYELPLVAQMMTGPGQLSAASGLSWSVVSGQLPPGVTLNASTGAVAGTPTTAGSYSFTARAALPDGRSDTKGLTIVVRDAVRLAVPAAVPPSEVGVPFRLAVSATGGTGTFTWTLAGTLPAGLALGTDGAIAGTPRQAGTFAFALTATDQEQRTAQLEGRIVVAPRLAIVRVPARKAKVGRAFKLRLRTVGGVAPKTWRLRGKLPKGVRFDRTLGVLRGIPVRPGRYRVVAEARDALRVKATRTIVIVVRR